MPNCSRSTKFYKNKKLHKRGISLTSSSFFFARNLRVEERKKEIFEQCSNHLDAYVYSRERISRPEIYTKRLCVWLTVHFGQLLLLLLFFFVFASCAPASLSLNWDFRWSKHWWFNGRILASHARDPGSIPGQCKFSGILPIFYPRVPLTDNRLSPLFI